MIFYVLLTYEAQPSGSIRQHPAAKVQLKFIKRVVSSYPNMKVDIKFDYARRIDSLDSLPALKQVLVTVRGIDGVKVWIDDLSRIFRVTKFDARRELLEDLQEFGASLYSMKHRITLADFSTVQLRVRGHSGFSACLISDSSFPKGGLNGRRTVCCFG